MKQLSAWHSHDLERGYFLKTLSKWIQSVTWVLIEWGESSVPEVQCLFKDQSLFIKFIHGEMRTKKKRRFKAMNFPEPALQYWPNKCFPRVMHLVLGGWETVFGHLQLWSIKADLALPSWLFYVTAGHQSKNPVRFEESREVQRKYIRIFDAMHLEVSPSETLRE